MPSTAAARPCEILLVEDNLGDIELTREALEHHKFNNNLSVVQNGEDALAYVRQQGKFSHVVRPDLILLDLNLPRKSGQEVLEELKQDPELRRIPVVILTTSRDEEDVLDTYDAHANCFITKPLDLDQFLKVVQSLENFWMSIVVLPPT